MIMYVLFIVLLALADLSKCHLGNSVGPVRPDYGSDVQVRVMQYGPSRQLHRQVVSLHGCKQPHPV